VFSPLRIFFPAILLLVVVTAVAQNYDQQAHGLAQKIASGLKPREAAFLLFQNISTMNPSDVNAARTALERELRALGVALAAPSQGGVEVAVTLSEGLEDSVWVAEVRQADGPEIFMEVRPKPPAMAATPSMMVEKKFLLEDDQQILDLAPMGLTNTPRELLVLDSDAVSVYENTVNGWQRKLAVRIPAPHPWPRDLRGRLMVQGDAYQAYLPGLTCHGNASGGLGISCRDESLWPLGAGPGMLGFAQFTPSRNYFDGRIVGSNGSPKNLPAFFSVASVETRGDRMWAFAGTDARTHLYNATLENAGGWTGWGSDIAGVASECGERSQLLVTASGDGAVTDSVAAYEIVGGSPQPVGEAVSFPGPVAALWPATERGVAIAVSRDLKSGRYAAFRLAITCAH
jgi:hypothetical protein